MVRQTSEKTVPEATVSGQVDLERDIDLYDLSRAVASHGEVRYEGDRLAIITDWRPWAYAAVVPVEAIDVDLDAWSLEVVLAVRVETGNFQIGLLNREETDFLTTATVSAGTKWHTVTLRTRQPARLGRLVVRNAADAGVSRGVCLLLRTRVWIKTPAEGIRGDPSFSDVESAAAQFEVAAEQLARVASAKDVNSDKVSPLIRDTVQHCRRLFERGGFALMDISGEAIASLFTRLDNDALCKLVRPLAVLAPLQPIPGWQFDSVLEDGNLATFVRYALWHALRDRSLGEKVVVPWHGDTLLGLSSGTDLSFAIFVAGSFEPNEFALLRRVLEPGMCMIDGGANEGAYTLYAAARVGSAGRVLSIEPSPRELDRLRANLGLNNMPQIEVAPFALAEGPGELPLLIAENAHAGQNTLGQFMYPGVSDLGRITVAVTTIDELVQRYHLDQVDVVKLDLEGAELRALIGANATLQKHRPMLLLEAAEGALRNQGSSCAALKSFILELGYRLFHFDRATGELTPLIGEMSSDTLIAVHPGREFGLVAQ